MADVRSFTKKCVPSSCHGLVHCKLVFSVIYETIVVVQFLPFFIFPSKLIGIVCEEMTGYNTVVFCVDKSTANLKNVTSFTQAINHTLKFLVFFKRSAWICTLRSWETERNCDLPLIWMRQFGRRCTTSS